MAGMATTVDIYMYLLHLSSTRKASSSSRGSVCSCNVSSHFGYNLFSVRAYFTLHSSPASGDVVSWHFRKCSVQLPAWNFMFFTFHVTFSFCNAHIFVLALNLYKKKTLLPINTTIWSFIAFFFSRYSAVVRSEISSAKRYCSEPVI